MTGRLARRALAIVVMLALTAPAAADRKAPPRCDAGPGRFAFHYGPHLEPDELAWLGRFQIVVPGDVLPARQVDALRRSGSRLFVYRWLTGLYGDADGAATRDAWAALVRGEHPGWLLNAEHPDAGPDGRGRAYYYDPFPRDLALARAKSLADTLARASYTGVFFDLVGSAYVPEPLRLEYRARHAEAPFDLALGEHLRALKHTRPATTIFTNQGYRTPEVYLPLADYDLSESLMTSYDGGDVVTVQVEGEGRIEHTETFYRPWDELSRIVDSIDADVRRYNPAVKIFHLNYVTPLLRPTGRREGERPVFRKEVNRPAIYYGYAAAKLWGHESFSASAPVRAVRDGIYFADLGRPLGATWEERDGLVRRYYEKGVVVVNPSTAPRTASLRSELLPPAVSALWDCYAGKAVDGLEVTVPPTVSAATGRVYPAGRVYLHLP